MPQMSALLWMPLFILFSLMFLFSSTKMYFYMENKVKESKKLSLNSLTNMNWKW